ncbi:MAG: serine protease [Amphiplicatus sp.]
MIEPLLLTAPRILTFNKDQRLTNATSFFFERDGRLYLVTSRHVVIDEPSRHFPDRVEIEMHTDPENLAQSASISIPLFENGERLWREGVDRSGPVDVAVLAVDRSKLPETAAYRAFTPKHLLAPYEEIEIGTRLLVVGFPLGFHDTLHHLPVARHGAIASTFGLRFQGEGYFLSDARTHRGASGAPVVARIRGRDAELGDLPWLLLGVHSSRLDIGARDVQLDEALGLNCVWYADILNKLTEN